MKKALLIFFMVLLLAGGIHAQKMSLKDEKNNQITAELSVFFPGIGVSYERIFNSKISLGGNFYWCSLPPFIINGFPNNFGLDTFIHYHPWGKTFFIGLGLGFTYLAYQNNNDNLYGAAITPETGWKINIKNAGGFYLQPGVKWSFIFGKGWDNNFTIIGAPGMLYLGFGYTF